MRSDVSPLVRRQTTRNPSAIWMTAVIASFVVLAAAIVGPRPAFSGLCHQLAERSFAIGGHLFAVCHRCTGIYAGAAVGLLVVALGPVSVFLRRRGLLLLAVAVLVVVMDVTLDGLGLIQNSAFTRVTSGFALGVAGGAFLGISIFHSNSVSHDR